MKKIIIFLILFTTYLFSYSQDIRGAVAVAIFHENGVGENIQHKRETKGDYNGICYSKIVVFGFLNQAVPKVLIGNSIGTQIKSIPIYNKNKINIGQEITYKHYTIKSGDFKIYIDNKLYDSKTFVK